MIYTLLELNLDFAGTSAIDIEARLPSDYPEPLRAPTIDAILKYEALAASGVPVPAFVVAYPCNDGEVCQFFYIPAQQMETHGPLFLGGVTLE